jgi:hypothetical protein
MEAGHGGRRPEWEGVTAFFSLFHRDQYHPSKFRSRAQIRRTFSAVIFAKEPLTFIILEPVVLGVITEVRFFILKMYFFSVN